MNKRQLQTGKFRWVGAHRVVGGPFLDDTPIFAAENDRYVMRFHIEPIVWLPVEHSIPIQSEHVWKHLSFTKDLPEGSSHWTGKVRRSLVRLSDADGAFLLNLLQEQNQNPKVYPYDKAELEHFLPDDVTTLGGPVQVVVPHSFEEDIHAEETPLDAAPLRESHRMQGVIAGIGEKMGFKVWLPRNDRSNVTSMWRPQPGVLLDELPLGYDGATLKTIANIDVIWLKRRSIVRAFEVEHSTAVYSGLLRMADLVALQPNMDIKLHIVAPMERKDKVFDEIRRPVMTLLEKGPLRNYCTFISYDSLEELAAIPHLEHLSDSVLGEYEEQAPG